MCLSFIDNTLDKDIQKNIRYGYKVFNEVEGKILGECFYIGEYPVNKWLCEGKYRDPSYKRKKKIRAGLVGKYRIGFHCFVDLKDAKKWAMNNQVIKKVEVKDIVAMGWEGEKQVFVCKKMKILNRKFKK